MLKIQKKCNLVIKEFFNPKKWIILHNQKKLNLKFSQIKKKDIHLMRASLQEKVSIQNKVIQKILKKNKKN